MREQLRNYVFPERCDHLHL